VRSTFRKYIQPPSSENFAIISEVFEVILKESRKT
jgi:hypothetical protein